MISGDFDLGIRGTDHRMIESLMDIDRYDDNFWSKLHAQTGVVMYVPETKFALIAENQQLTEIQKELLESVNAKIEVHCKEYIDQNVSEASENNQDQVIVNYKNEYKKHLENNYIGREENEVNKDFIKTVDGGLENKPNLSLQLRQEAIAELLKDNREDKNFKKYLSDKSELLSHGLRHFDSFQQRQLVSEDLKLEKYQASGLNKEENILEIEDELEI